MFSARNNFCSGFKWKYVFTKNRKSAGSSPLHWEAHSDSQQPSTQEIHREQTASLALLWVSLGWFSWNSAEKYRCMQQIGCFFNTCHQLVLMLNGRCWQSGWVKTFETFPGPIWFLYQIFFLDDLDLITWVWSCVFILNITSLFPYKTKVLLLLLSVICTRQRKATLLSIVSFAYNNFNNR